MARKVLRGLGLVAVAAMTLGLSICSDTTRVTRVLEGCPPGQVKGGKCCATLEDGRQVLVRLGIRPGDEVKGGKPACWQGGKKDGK